MKRILSVALALLLVLGLLPVANAAELSEFGKIKEQEYVSGGERGNVSSTNKNDMKNGKLFDAAPDVDVEEPKDTDIVSIIVELDGEPAMAVSESVKSASAAEAKLLEKQNLKQAEIENALGVKLNVKHNYTLLYNGFSFEGEYSLVKKIRDLGINAYVSPEFEVPNMHTSVGLIGADVAWDYGYTGEGQTIAIIDTGIRLTHEAFSVVPENIAWTQETLQALVSAAGSNLNAGSNVSQLYKSGKIPFAYNYYSNNYNPGHGSSDHGSHVAGIAAGNNGSDFKGVAPDAQLVVMQVFTPMGGAYWSEILAALEDCAYLGVDAANMSLGSSCGFTDYNGDSTYERVLGLVADAGVNLSVAAGNDGATYEGNHWEGRQLASNPDYGVVGSPATFPESLCVAASNNLGGSEGVVEAYGESFAYNDRSGDPAVAFSTLNGEQEYVVVPGLGNPSDFTGIDVTGKIALIVRGEINFSDKVANAYQAGAIGVIIYNNEAGVINMAVDNYFVPAVSITQVAGQHLVNNATNGIGTLTVSGMDATGTPTAFSSRGTTADLKIKPEIMAPGANINSVDGFTSNSSYKLSDGTSMAAPHVAGGMAIVQEYVDEMFPNADESRKMELVDAILMSTAIPRVDGNGNPFVVREQGAGMMNLGNALTTTAYLSVSDNVRPKLEVGSSENGVFELNFTVNNFGDTALTYTINPIVITETPKVLGEYGGETVYYIDGTPYALNDVVELDMPESVTVPAGGTADVSVTVTLTDAAKTFFADHFDAGMFVEGFVELEGVADGEGAIPSTLNIPFLGFYGDWNHPAMIEEGAYYYQDEPTYSQVRENLIGYKAGSQIQGLGINPYVDMTEAQFLADRGAVSPNGDGWFESINVAYINLMRNASYAEYAVEINGSSTVLSRGTYVKKGHMPDGDPYQQMGYNYMSFPTWNASALTEGQSAVIKIRADLANEGYTTEANANGVWEVPVTKDLTAPEIVSVEVIEGGIRITFTDAHYVAYAKVYGNNDVYYDNGIFENERGANTTIDVMTTEPQVVLFLGDYAANESEYTINTATGEYEGGGQIDPPGPVETILYEWGFEDISEVAEWLTADADGDGQEWTLFRDASGEIPYEGTGFLGSYSYLNNVGPLTPDNWTITQNLTLPDDADEISLKYFIRGVDDTYFAENYSVYVGPANPSNTGQFTRLFGETIATAGWNEKVVDLSAYAGQTITIAFRHHGCTDQYTLALDNMSIVSTTGDEPPVTPTPPVPSELDEALNVEGGELLFVNDAVNPWIVDDIDDRLSAVTNIQGQGDGSTTISTRVEMAAGEELTFDWKISSEISYDYLIFKVDGRQIERTSGFWNWSTVTWTAPDDGTYTFSWTYSKDSGTDTGSDCGWVDNVSVDYPTPPTPPPAGSFIETNEIIPGEEYIIAVDYLGEIMMMSNVLDSDNSIRLVGDPAQMSGDAIVGGYSNNHLWTFSSETASTIQSVGNGRYCEVVTHNGYAWLGLSDSAMYNWSWDGNGNMITDAPGAGMWNHLSYAYTAEDIEHPAFDLWIYGESTYLPIKLYKAIGEVPPTPPVTPTPTVPPTPPVTPTPTVPPTPTPIVPGDLDEALNIEGGTLTFANDEVYPWEVRDNYAASGNAGVESSTSTVTTTVELAEGEALFFDWSTSSEANYDKLIFSVDGTAVRNISGEVDWTQFYYVAPAAGTYTFTWSYTKDGSVDRNNDEGYLDNVYVGEAPEVPEADMYAFNSFEGSWITFNSGDPSMATPVGAPGATVFAAEYVDGTVYGYTDAGQFFTTTLNNMSNLNVVGTIGEVIVDMAYNYATGMMYAIGSSENQEGPRTLYTVDLATGGITAVGSLDDTAVAAIMTLGITTEGEAYGISFAPGNQTNDSYLHTINLETAECEAIGPTGFPINYVQTMTYDHNNDQMLWAQFYSDGMFTQTSALVAVNLETGAGTQLGSTPVGGEVGELLGMFSVPGEGPTPPPADYTVEVGTVEANPGSTVRIPVTVNGLAAAAFELSYDADMFTYVGYTNPVAEAFVTVNDLVAGELTIAMMNYEANYEGEAIILEFAVAGDCEDGEYAIPVEVISAAAIIDGATTGIDASEVDAIAGAINVVNGYTVTFMYNGEIIAEVTVPVGGAAEAPEMDRYIYDEESGYYHVFCGWDKDFSSVYENMTVNAIYGILGDVNNDGTVNITDATMLMRGVVGMEALSELQELLADVNCDGSVGISDATLIARFVTGLETFPVPMD
ncbi:MAG: S8 family serine peptidase [Candidatus Gastranaerophilaceae bacterium]